MKSFVCNFDDEVHVDFLWVEVLNEFVGCHCCAARCQEVVMNQYNVIFVDGVDVHLDEVRPHSQVYQQVPKPSQNHDSRCQRFL